MVRPPRMRCTAGSSSPARTRSSTSGIGRARSARHAHHLSHGAVDLDHAIGVATGRLVKAVDVLGDEGMQDTAALEVHEGTVAGVGLRLPRR